MKHRILCIATACLLAAVALGCLPKAKPRVITTRSGQEYTSREVRVRLYELSGRLSGRLEIAADDIGDAAQDSRMRMKAVRFKSEVVPALYRASFQADPIIAVADVWLFIFQLEDWLTTGRGKDHFGPHQGIAIAAVRRMNQEFEEFLIEHGGPDAETRELIRNHAAERPIGRSISTRPAAIAAMVEHFRKGKLGAFAAVGSLVEGFNDLSDPLSTPFGKRCSPNWSSTRKPSEIATCWQSGRRIHVSVVGLVSSATLERRKPSARAALSG